MTKQEFKWLAEFENSNCERLQKNGDGRGELYVYENCSHWKESEWQNIIYIAEKFNTFPRIMNACTMTFTAGFVYIKNGLQFMRVYTKFNIYEFVVDIINETVAAEHYGLTKDEEASLKLLLELSDDEQEKEKAREFFKIRKQYKKTKQQISLNC